VARWLLARAAAWIGVALALSLASVARLEVFLGLDYDGLILKPYSAIDPGIGFFSGKIPEELSIWFPLTHSILQNPAALSLTGASPAALLVVHRGPETFCPNFRSCMDETGRRLEREGFR